MAMATTTEAACLLESGALYGRRVLLRAATGAPIFAGFKPGAFSLYFGDSPIFHFDLEGRWQRAYADDLHYLRALDGTIQTLDRRREGKNLILRRKTLNPTEAQRFDDRVRSTALDLLDALDAGRFERSDPPSKASPLTLDELRETLRRIAAWDAEAWSAHRDAYQQTYGPLPFVPPDCPSPVLLQATLGHESGVAFAGAPPCAHAARTPGEFAEHARRVAALLGRRLEQGKSIFLAGSDALRRPADRVAGDLEAIGRVFPGLAAAGIHTFLDRFDAPLPDREALRRFRALGLVRVSLGVESGDPSLRAAYRKSGTDEALRSFVSDLKAAGLGVSILTLVGVGGDEARHLDATAALLESLDLGPGDLVCLLDAREFAPTGGDPRPEDFKARLAGLRSARKVKVVAYSMEKQNAG